MMEGDMPPGHVITANPNAVVRVVLGCSSWAVLALSLFVERFSQVHYRASVEAGEAICPLWRDVFLFHWREESQHTIPDVMEFLREDARLDAPARDAAVGELSRCWTRSTASCRGRWWPTPPTSAPLPACRRTRCAAGASRGCS